MAIEIAASVDIDACRHYLERLQTQEVIDQICNGSFDCEKERPKAFNDVQLRMVKQLENLALAGDIDNLIDRIKTYRTKAFKPIFETPVQELTSTLARVKPLSPDETDFPPLPDHVKKQEEQAHLASPWLNEYIAFSKIKSPRGYEGFHEAVGLSCLSTVAGRRVYTILSDPEYTPLYTVLVGFTTLFRKTTTAKLYFGLLRASGLDWLLGANIVTPQKLLQDMAGRHVPSSYDTLSIEDQERTKRRLAMSGQRGWYYEEFGMQLDAMAKDTGVMGEFKGLLRVLDDCQPVYESGTVGRGTDRIENPYLSLVASMTPSDLKPHAGKEHKFWSDGLFARIAFVCPPRGAKGRRDRFSKEYTTYPAALVDPLKKWNERLGEPVINIVPQYANNGTTVTGHTIERGELPQHECKLPDHVEDAFYYYEGALLDFIEGEKIPVSLYGSYGRLHKLALRVATLLASLENKEEIEMRHWARGQQYAENRRRDLHELFAQVNENEYDNETSAIEEAILTVLENNPDQALNGALIIQKIGERKLKGQLNSKKINETCESLARAGCIQIHRPTGTQKTARYQHLSS